MTVKMNVCTFDAQLGTFLGNHKNNEFLGKFMEISSQEETTSFSRKSFSSRNDRLCICTVFSSPTSAKFTEKRDSSLMKTTPQGGCHETA